MFMPTFMWRWIWFTWVVEDQAAVLFARFTPGGDFGLDGGQGMILQL